MRLEGMGKPEGGKLIRFSADVDGGLLQSIRIRGDFFAGPEEGFDRVEARLAGIPLADLAGAFDGLLAEEGVEVFGITGAALASLVSAAWEAATAAAPGAP
jgi:hypothetical protein